MEMTQLQQQAQGARGQIGQMGALDWDFKERAIKRLNAAETSDRIEQILRNAQEANERRQNEAATFVPRLAMLS